MIATAGNFRRVFSTDEGQAVLADLLEFVGFWDNGPRADPRMSNRDLGQKDVVYFILDRIGLSSDYREVARSLLAIPSGPPAEEQQEGEDSGAIEP